MIELTDRTLREAKGDFDHVVRIMKEETSGQNWMLRTDAFVTCEFIAAKYTLHFWKNGNVIIYETDRPMRMDVSDDDLRELSYWCKVNKWKELQISDRLLVDRIAFEYWKRAFIAGLVKNDALQEYEDQEMKRLMETQFLEEKEDAS